MTEPDVTLSLVCDSPRHPTRRVRICGLSLWNLAEPPGWEFMVTRSASTLPDTIEEWLSPKVTKMMSTVTTRTLAAHDGRPLGADADEWSYRRQQAGLDGETRHSHTFHCQLGCSPLTVRAERLAALTIHAHVRGELLLTLSGIRDSMSGKQ